MRRIVYIPGEFKHIVGLDSVDVHGVAAPPKSHSQETIVPPELVSVSVMQLPLHTPLSIKKPAKIGSQSTTETETEAVF